MIPQSRRRQMWLFTYTIYYLFTTYIPTSTTCCINKELREREKVEVVVGIHIRIPVREREYQIYVF